MCIRDSLLRGYAPPDRGSHEQTLRALWDLSLIHIDVYKRQIRDYSILHQFWIAF